MFLWLAILNRCWMADRLARRGLQHPDKSLLCDQEDETVKHILTSCVFTRQVWTSVLQRVGLPHLAPSLEFATSKDWWRWIAHRAPKAARKGLNSLMILTAWSIWKMRNRCIFNGCHMDARPVLQETNRQAHRWPRDSWATAQSPPNGGVLVESVSGGDEHYNSQVTCVMRRRSEHEETEVAFGQSPGILSPCIEGVFIGGGSPTSPPNYTVMPSNG